MKIIISILLASVLFFNAQATEDNQLIFSSVNHIQETLAPFIATGGLFSGKYFKNGDNECDFSNLQSQEQYKSLDSAIENIIESKKAMQAILASVHNSHVDDSYQNILFEYKGTKYNFIAVKDFKEHYLDWEYLVQAFYRTYERAFRFFAQDLPIQDNINAALNSN